MPSDLAPQASADPFPLRRAQVQANGASVHVIERGQGPAVLFCHGFPDTAETWRSQMRAVAKTGHHAVALDMRGFGASYAPSEASLYSALHTVGDLVGVLDALGIRSAVLVGHDWGADAAARAMVMRPDRFRAMVSLSIPFQPRGEISTWDELRRQGFGDRYYAFGMMEPDAEARFEPAERTIPSILYWLSASPPRGTGWDPVDPARHMLRPAPADVPSWADRTTFTIRSARSRRPGSMAGSTITVPLKRLSISCRRLRMHWSGSRHSTSGAPPTAFASFSSDAPQA